jgi:hypothetical protein
VERYAEQTLDLLARRERAPLRIGEASSQAAEVWEGYQLAGDRIDGAGLALSAERHACHADEYTSRRDTTGTPPYPGTS